MKVKNIKISDSAKVELGNARIEGDKLHLDGQVKNYAELKKIFSQINVVWNKKEKVHYLGEGAQEQINHILNGGQIVDEKKTFQAFFTPSKLAAEVVGMAEVNGKICLEPSAGIGALADELKVQGAARETVLVELNPEFVKQLEEKGYHVYEGNFLEKQFPSDAFDRVVMNPPFDKNTWVKHIEHAWNFIKDGGRLVAVCPSAKHNKFFQRFVEGKDYSIKEVPAGEFSESGTQIATMIVSINK